jgi:hypothetical protein
MGDRLNRLIRRGHFERAANCVPDPNCGSRATSQVGGDQNIRSGAYAFWHTDVGRQLELDNSVIQAKKPSQ